MPSDVSPPAPATFLADEEAWRAARLARLRSKDGWLSLVDRVVLDAGDNALEIGVATLTAGEVRVRLRDGVVGHVGAPDGPATSEHVWPKGANGPHLFVGTRRWEILRQADLVAVRARDPASAALQRFQGVEMWTPDPRFCVEARLVAADPPRTITLTVGLGAAVDHVCPGTLVFTIDGREMTLDPVLEDDVGDKLFILFRDPTNGKSTYGAGRFLYASLPDAHGRVVVDFNKAYNPPCALTDFASCPVAPPQNRLPIEVLAGEKYPLAHSS